MLTSSTEEVWKPIAGYEDRYAVSNLGNVKALSFLQRYVHWRTGLEGWRRTKERAMATQFINSGYLIVHLHLDNKRTALLVHRLVAAAFLPGAPDKTVNHIDGVKSNNRADNLEWCTYTNNHLHAVDLGLNLSAVRVKDPSSGVCYPSITQAAKRAHRSHRTVRSTFIRLP